MSDLHPIVGTWRVAVAIGNAAGPVNLATLNADGTIVVVFPSPTPGAPGSGRRIEFWTPALGAWAAGTGNTVTMQFVALGTDENGGPIGTHTVRAAVEVAGDGWQGPFTIDIAAPDGSIQATVAGTVTATRITAAASQ